MYYPIIWVVFPTSFGFVCMTQSVYTLTITYNFNMLIYGYVNNNSKGSVKVFTHLKEENDWNTLNFTQLFTLLRDF